MRVKTEDRKQAIIETAVQVFREVGYERASMTTISSRLGGSKGTLYGYFRSKEELFEAAMKAAVEAPGDQIMELLDPNTDDLRHCLEQFGSAYLDFILAEDVLAIKRTAAADGFSTPLGPHLFDQGPRRAVKTLTTFFAQQITRERLRKVSPVLAALHFKGLIETGFLEEALYGAELQFNRQEALVQAVDAFLRAYSLGETTQSVEPALEKAKRGGGARKTVAQAES